MARLGWDNVAAPDFSGAQSGLSSAAAMINQALAGAKTGVNEFQQIQEDKVNSGILAQLAAMQSPEDAAQIPGLISSADPTQINASTFAALMGRGSQLRQNRLGEIELKDTENKFDRSMAFQTALDSAKPELDAFYQTVRNNPMDTANITKAGAAVSAKFNGAPIDKVLKFMDELQSSERDSLGLASTRQGYNHSQTNQNWRVEDREFEHSAEEWAGKAVASGLFTRADAESYFRSNGLTGRLFNAAMAKTGNLPGYGDYTAPTGSDGGFGGAAGGDMGATRIITGGGKGNLGLGSVPPSVQTLGQAVEFGKGLNNRGQESSAMGIYQITQSTLEEFAPKALGNGWQNQKFDDPRVQDAVAKKIFEHASKQKDPVAALRGRWVSLSPADAQQMLQVGWERGRDIVSRKESSSAASSLIAAASNAVDQTEVAAADMEGNAGNSLPTKFFELSGSKESPAQVAARLAKEIPGANPDWLESRIVSTMSKIASGGGSRRNVNAAIVGQAILDNSGAQSAREGWYNPKRWVPDSWRGNTIGEDKTVDMDAVFTAVDGYSKGRMDDTIAANATRGNIQQQKQAAGQRVQQIEAQIARKQREAQARGFVPNLQAEMADLAIARKQAQDVAGLRGAPGNALPGRDTNALKAAAVAKAAASAERARVAQAKADLAAKNAQEKAARAAELARSEKLIAERSQANKPKPVKDPAFEFYAGLGKSVAKAASGNRGNRPVYETRNGRRVLVRYE